ncbi:MAG: efflux RND transporter permease subunit [Cyanobacteria bacterium P01_D01_bin.73]
MFVNFFLRRPVFASVCSLVIVLVGLVSFGQLPVQEFPQIDPPVVTISTVYLGASPETVETEVTEILEREVNGAEGIDTLTSSSSQSQSQIRAQFLVGQDVNVAAQDVRDRVARAVRFLPEEAESPIVRREAGDASPIVWIALSGGGRLSSLEVNDYAEQNVIDVLEALPGVSRVFIGGQRRYAMRLWVDPRKLVARNLTVRDIEDALREQNIEIPSGRLEGNTTEYSVRVQGRLRSPEEYEKLVLAARPDGTTVKFTDVGRVELGAENERTFARSNGDEAIALGIVKLSTANTLAVADAAVAEMERLSERFPEGMSYRVAFDRAEFVARAIQEVWSALAIAIILTIVSIFVFLHDWRATLIPAVTIPVSLIGSLGVIAALGYSINTLTLFALTLATGLVVDDTIVVLENVIRYLQKPKDASETNGAAITSRSPFAATAIAAKEVFFAVIATTVVLVAVFVPVLFSGGATGRLFAEFSATLAGAVVVSTFVALTLAPPLCARLLRPQGEPKGIFAAFDRGLSWTRDRYSALLKTVVRSPGLVILIFLISTVGGWWCFNQLPRELLPVEDRGVVLTFVNAPDGSSLPYTDRVTRKVEGVFKDNSAIEGYFTVGAFSRGSGVGQTNRAIAFAKLHPWEERSAEQGQSSVVGGLFGAFSQIPEARIFPVAPRGLPGAGFGSPLQLVIQGNDLEGIAAASDRLATEARELPELRNVDVDLSFTQPEVAVRISREKAAALGVEVRDIARTLQTLLGGREVTSFNRGNRRYEVIIQAESEFRADPQAIANLYIETNPEDGPAAAVPLGALVNIETITTPPTITHFNRRRTATLTASPAPGYSLGQALEAVQTLADKTLPDGFRTDVSGESRTLQQSGQTTLFIFGLSMAFVFLVLAAQFESYLDPLIIMLAVPLALLGAFGALLIFGQTLNAYSQVGLVVLIALATKNSILIVEFANQLRADGVSLVNAAIAAGRIRFRPILMTAFSTLFGILPLVLSSGPGAASRTALGVAVLGGMALSTVLSLGIVPAFYILFNRWRSPRNVSSSKPAISTANAQPTVRDRP